MPAATPSPPIPTATPNAPTNGNDITITQEGSGYNGGFYTVHGDSRISGLRVEHNLTNMIVEMKDGSSQSIATTSGRLQAGLDAFGLPREVTQPFVAKTLEGQAEFDKIHMAGKIEADRSDAKEQYAKNNPEPIGREDHPTSATGEKLPSEKNIEDTAARVARQEELTPEMQAKFKETLIKNMVTERGRMAIDPYCSDGRIQLSKLAGNSVLTDAMREAGVPDSAIGNEMRVFATTDGVYPRSYNLAAASEDIAKPNAAKAASTLEEAGKVSAVTREVSSVVPKALQVLKNAGELAGPTVIGGQILNAAIQGGREAANNGANPSQVVASGIQKGEGAAKNMAAPSYADAFKGNLVERLLNGADHLADQAIFVGTVATGVAAATGPGDAFPALFTAGAVAVKDVVLPEAKSIAANGLPDATVAIQDEFAAPITTDFSYQGNGRGDLNALRVEAAAVPKSEKPAATTIAAAPKASGSPTPKAPVPGR